MFEKRSGDYLHPGAIFHGAGLYEGLCVVKLIATKLLKDKAPWKSPIFAVSFLAVLTCFVSQICYMFTIAFLERPWGGLDGWTQYYLVAKMVVVIPGFNSNLINIVILMRLAAFYAKTSVPMLFLGTLCLGYFGLWITVSYLGVYSMTVNPSFWLAPTYKVWQLCSGIAQIIEVVIVLGGTLLFLGHIARSLNMSPLLLLREMAVKHDGPRWVAMIGLQIMSLCATFMGVLNGGVDTITVINYHVAPLNGILVDLAFMTLYLFLESSYHAAKDIVELHGASKKFTPTGATKSVSSQAK